MIAEGIEQAIWLGRIVDSSEEKSFTWKKKKLRFIISKVIIKARERTTKTKTPRDQSSLRQKLQCH